MTTKSFIIALTGLAIFTGCSSTSYTNMNDINTIVKNGIKKSSSPWNISNLYDKDTNSFFIPYQLWSGASWDGNKKASCMHKADNTFTASGGSATNIKGPVEWQEYQVWNRAKLNGSKEQYFTCHDKGIGRVYDSRKDKSYEEGRCKFPAGFNWKIGELRECTDTAIKITNISFDDKHNLSSITFQYFVEKRGGSLKHDHTYTYEPNQGLTSLQRQ
jgi:hypothetical protein